MFFAFTPWLQDLYIFSSSIAQYFYWALFLYSLINIRYFKNEYFWIFLLFSSFFFFEGITNIIDSYLNLENTWFWNHFYLFFSVVLQSVFYHQVIDNVNLKKTIKYGIPLMLFSIVFLGFYNEGYLRGSVVLPFKNIIFIFIYLAVHRQLIKQSASKDLKSNPLFWFNIAFLVMNIYSLVISSTMDYIMPLSNDLAFILLSIRNFFDPISCVLWIISIYKLRTWKFKPAASQSLSL